MRKLLVALLLSCVAGLASAADTARGLPRSTPEAQGIPSSAILALLEAADEKALGLHSLMLVRHGHVVAEGWWRPYERDDPHMLFSLSKSFASTGIGLAIAEGKLSLDDTVLSFFPEDAPAEPSDNLKAMRVRDLLVMSTGHHTDDLSKFSFDKSTVPLTRAFLALPVAHKPGTHFLYNTPASYMLSAIVQKATGQTLVDYLGPRLSEPLGIRSPKWDASPQGISLGGFGLNATTEDIARFGQLYLQRGAWQGRQLLPAEWVAAATARQTSNGSNPKSDWDQGYGYQFWRCRHGLYRGDGAFGQYAIVMPDQDAVVAITSGTRDMQAVMNLVWDILLPAMGKTALPADDRTRARLTQKLASLSLPPPAGSPSSPVAGSVAGKLYLLPKNDDGLEAVGLEAGAGTTLVLRIGGQERRLPSGYGEWRRGASLGLRGVEQKVAASGAWTSDDTYTAKVCAYETPFCNTLGLRFAGDAVVLDQEQNVAFGPTKRPQLVGFAPAAAATSSQVQDKFSIPASDSGLPGAGPIRRYDWFQSLWRERRSEWAGQVEQDRNAVVFLGDSITQGWGGGLGAAFPGMKVANRGISGDTTRGILLRLQEDVLALDPAAVVLLAGTNDLEEGATPEVIAGNLELILADLERHSARLPIVLCQVFPSSSTQKRPADRIKALNALYLAAAKKHPQVTYLETWPLFAGPEGDAKAAEFPDLLHPNEIGYAKWAAALRPVFSTLGLSETGADAFTPEEGFESLFNGRDLTGWGYRPTTEKDKASAARWQASDPAAAAWPIVTEAVAFDGLKASPDGRFAVVGGRLVVTAPREYRKIQQLWTTREFPRDFVLKLEFRATPNADSGVYLRGPQLQCRDYRLAGPYKELKGYKPQEWNELVITVKGGVAQATCNGEVLEAALAVPGSGPVGVEGDRGQMEYRRIRIKMEPSR